ncbi:unnamed protein product [Boreogadus saida]
MEDVCNIAIIVKTFSSVSALLKNATKAIVFKFDTECRRERWPLLVQDSLRLDWTGLGLTGPGLLPNASIKDGLKHTSCDRLEVNIWIIPMEQTSLPSIELV